MRDFLFNQRMFPFIILLKYYYYSYFLNRKIVTVKLKKTNFSKHNFTIRCRNRIDRNVIDYVFFKQYHQNQDQLINSSPVILDLGSNIGLTIADYKIKYPESKVYGYEMDKENFDLAIKNTSNFNNVKLFNKAVWKNKGTIRYDNNNVPDAYTINNNYSNKGIEVECISIPDILIDNNIHYVDILKMDIEGAELEIIYNHNNSWLSKIKTINIEFHNQTDEEMEKHVSFFINKGFNAKRGSLHWNSIEGFNNTLIN